MAVTNQQIAKILRELGGYYEIKNEPFKPRAYEKAADSIESLDEQLGQIYHRSGFKGLLGISGIGRGIAGHIEALLTTGELAEYNLLKKQIPINLSELTSIEGVGPKTANEFYKQLGIRNLRDLQIAVGAGRLKKLKGFGEKSQENIIRALRNREALDQADFGQADESVPAPKNRIARIIKTGDVRGDLQIQTNWTDGKNSIAEMAESAIQLGREYIAITDHTKALTVARGLDEKKLIQQGKEIDHLNSKFHIQHSKFRILKGAEVNILKNGELDIADPTLKSLDVVGVAVHSHFKLPRAEQTKRIIRAISNPHADILFHPTTRIIKKRLPIDFDFPAILKAAKKFRVALEINAHPERLDLHDKLIREAVAAGVRFTIDSDAHSTKELDYIHFGEAQARRGWAAKADILNTKSVEDLLKYLKNKR
ncbi:MAG: hypothetical protein A2846_03015 [Candidatus Doudnabacteria bacterium RIFCSPHIGHO2_01_FULL_49_9]|uniref:DNA polymerase III n=1 Tax=Candidatus Doudnabacteria bacterium RIFCSPHIGHO2_01_FULL_49_9 TaxID=1817827 RepID=A0A1F5P362_9BACT|nr:MAG: hypothetical protein A2846_03015 [Candidatus Doudnabacteria bacterium RIFCSPHIGHO2_01_FULL_49_9]